MTNLFTPPTVQETPAGESRLFRRYGIHRGVTVYIAAGVVGSTRFPFQGDVESWDSTFLGGRTYTVTDAEKLLLVAAGYTVVTA